MRCMITVFCHIRVSGVRSKRTHAAQLLQANSARVRASVSARTPRARATTYSDTAMEFLAHLWDDLDDVAGACRHVATAVLTETLASAVPFIVATSGTLLAGAAALLLSSGQLLRSLA